MLLRQLLNALKPMATRASVPVLDGGFQACPDMKMHGGCGQRGIAHLLLGVAATVHGSVYTSVKIGKRSPNL
jgi:hypothetical protein